MTSRRVATLLGTATLLGLLPFIDKAFHIDDPPFLWTARQILAHPADFYGFRLNWFSKEMPMAEVATNPPLTGYAIALVAAVTGFQEIPLHLAFTTAAMAAVIGTYALAARLTSQPVLAAAIVGVTPAFAISATTLMADTVLLACWTWAVVLWVSGIDDHRTPRLAGAVVLTTMALLTKYYGAALVPLLAVYTVARQRRVTAALAWFAIPIVGLAAYDFYTAARYGRDLLFGSAHLALTQQSFAGHSMIARTVTGLAFTGGCLATAALYAPLLWPPRWLAVGLPLSAVGIFGLASVDPFVRVSALFPGGVPWPVWIHLILFGVAGTLLLTLAILDVWQHRDPGALLLFLWTIGGFAFAAFLNWTINGRTILIMAPAVAILLVRRLEYRISARRDWHVWIPLAAGVVLTVAVAWADYTLANSARIAADRIFQSYGDRARTIWFQGHWGFQYYMESRGARAMDSTGTVVSDGDLVIVPSNNTTKFPLNVPFTLLNEVQVPSPRWLTTMHPQRGAGFYSDFMGPLPFAVGGIPPERYAVIRIGRPREPRAPDR